jgi:hypothetical protein
MDGHCAFVDVTYTERAKSADFNDCTIMWCRYCGKIEIYETIDIGSEDEISNRVIDLTPKVTQIVKEMLDD